MDVGALRATLPALQNCIYLNSGASAPSPHRVLEAIDSFLHRQANEGPFVPPLLEEELRIEAEVRAAIAQCIGADAAEIALCNNTTDGLNLIAAGFDWRPDDEVVTIDQEHPSGLLPWFYLRDRIGIRVKVIAVPADVRTLPRLIEGALTARSRLVSISHASWCTGTLFPIREIVDAAHRHGAGVVIDGAQGPGHLPVNVKTLGCDYYALSGQKWLMGPHGTGALYVSSSAIHQPQPSHLGWASALACSPDGEYTLHPDCRRYEYATTNHGLLSGLREALKLYEEHGAETVWNRILELSGAMEDRLRRIPRVEIVSPRGPDLSTGLLVFRLANRSPEEVVDRLWTNHRIAARWVFPLAVRVSLHVFNLGEELDRVADAVRKLA